MKNTSSDFTHEKVKKLVFFGGNQSDKNQIIDYKLNQFKCLKQLAYATAIRTTTNWLTARMSEIQGNLDDPANDLPEMHASAAGLKGLCCDDASTGIEELRKTCGGAGYLLASGIAQLELDYKWRSTAEGDTVVMLLQTARYLIKAADQARQGKELSGLTECLKPLKHPQSFRSIAITFMTKHSDECSP